MAKRVSVDKWLFAVTLLLVVIGLIMVFSASAVVSSERHQSPYTFLWKQLVYAAIGLLAMFATMHIDYKRFKHPALVFTSLAVPAVLLVAVFFLDRSHNTHRWIRFAGFSFQPSELAKPAIILFLAWFLETRSKSINDWKHTLLPAIAPTLFFAVLIVAEPDLGTAMVCVAVTSAMLFTAGMYYRYLGLGVLATLPFLGYLILMKPWRLKRILVFLNPDADPQSTGYQIIQSLIAVGTGGLTGLGLMEGKQKLFYLPEAHTDFIFAVIAEEWGLIGALFVVILFAVFCWRGIRTALATRDNFARLLAVGVTALVGVQAFFNISVVIGLLPAKGIPLPLISYGGSSLIVTLASIGVLLNISQQAE